MKRLERDNYFSELIKTNNLKNEEQVVVFLKNNPHVIDDVISNTDEDPWLYFESNTYDGWYCINNEKYGEYNVYFKERGLTSHANQFTTRVQEEAIARVLVWHGSIKFQ